MREVSGVGRMGATLATLTVLRVLSEGPASGDRLLSRLREELGEERDGRSLRRYIEVLGDSGFEIRRREGKYELLRSPVRLGLTDYEALATLSVVESLAEREPVYGEHLASAAEVLRSALPEETLKFVDSGRVEFELVSASDPPEDPAILDLLRRAVPRRQRVEIFYGSSESGSRRWRPVEPVRVYYAQKAHRLDAYDPTVNGIREFRVNYIEEARMLPEKFSPEAHRLRFDSVKVRLEPKTFKAFGRSILPDPSASIEPLENGGAIISGRTPSLFWTVREVAALGSEAEVLGGEEFLRFLCATAEKYS